MLPARLSVRLTGDPTMKPASLPQHDSTPAPIRNPQSAIRALFAALLAVSWQRWTSVIADSGRELDLPLRLLRGEALYRDVHYLYPPFSPYFNALLYRLFGTHLSVLQISGALCSLALIWLCYRLARRLMSEWESALAVGGVVVWCVFKPAGNLISPYSYAALHASVFALTAVWLTLKYVEREQAKHLVCAGLCLGLAAVTKQEFALAAALTAMAALSFVHRYDWRALLRGLALAAGPALLIALPVYAWLLSRFGWALLVEDCHLFFTHLPASLVFYNAQRTGLSQPLASLWQMLGAAAVCAAAVSLVSWWSVRRSAPVLAWRALLGLGGALLLVLLVATTSRGQWDGSPLRALPLLLLALIWLEWRRGKPGHQQSAALFILAVYSLAVLGRVALRVPSGGAFGSFFLPTSLVLIYFWLTHRWPETLARWTQAPQAATTARALGRGLLVAAWLVTAVVFGVRYRKNFSYEITTPRGTFHTTANIGPAYREALDFIATHTQPGEAIAVLPEGSDLAFFSVRQMPLRHQILIPGLMSAHDEAAAIELLEQQQVRYVLIVNRPMREFGAVAFGRDFYQRLGGWLEEHYRVRKICGAPGQSDVQIGAPGFFIKLLERK
jgi:4-amino-4-deoxy-L-arabinose transferase-like glycosyltransferase